MHLTLHLTDRCNLACRYCYAKAGTQDMPLATAQAAIRRCAEGPDCGIVFFGGEPLLRQELIWDVIRWCEAERPNRFHYKVTTNGTLLDAAFVEQAIRSELHVAISHDGVREAHDRHRVKPGGAGTFDEIAPGLRLLLEQRPYSPVLLTVNPDTVEHYAESAEWLQAQGARYLIGSLNYAAPWTDRALRALRRQYLRLEKWHLENHRRERKMYFSPFDKRIATRIFPERSTSCRLGRRQISVGPDGRLYPCVQFVGRAGYAIGTAEAGIDEARRQALYERNECDKPECAGCVLAPRCHNKCGCLNLQTTGGLEHVPALLCEHERMVFPIADRLAERLYRERNALFLHRHYNPAFPVLSFLEDISAP